MPRVVLLASVVALVACRDPLSISPVVSTRSAVMAVSAPEIGNYRIPYPPGTIVGPCTGEPIALSGEIHVVTKIWQTGDAVRIQGHINLNVAGIGLSTGRKYRFHQITNSDQEFVINTPNGSARQVFHLYIISQGAAPNWSVTMNGEFQFSAGGVEFISRKSEAVCR